MPQATPTAPEHPSRRQALKLFGVPLILPLGTLSAAALTACGSDDDGPASSAAPATFVSAAFSHMPAPSLADAAAMAYTSTASTLEVALSDGSTKDYALAYEEFFITGDTVARTGGGSIVAGGYFDAAGNPIIDGTQQIFSDCVDGSSLLSVASAPAGTVFAVVQYEYNSKDYGAYPSPITVLTLAQDAGTGALTLKSYFNVDTFANGEHGLWIPCGGSLSPWGTHLSSEEYMPDAFDQGDNQTLALLQKFSNNAFGNANANPYWYGHLPEITVKADGTGTFKKHRNLGRYSRELVQVFPDNRTVLGGDDTTNGGLFLFIADAAGDLSAGMLYVARYTSLLSEASTDPASGATIQWIKLGHASDGEIKALIDSAAVTTVTQDATTRLKSNGIFQSIKEGDRAAYETATASTLAADGFTRIAVNGNVVWVKLQPGAEKAAAFLETHRYASLKGGSLAFTKMEGTTVNAKDKVAYSAISAISASMVSGAAFDAARNVQFSANSAGCVLAHQLGGGQKDSDGNDIASEWVPVSTSVLLAGAQISADAVGNTNDPEKISCPDNLKFSEKLRTLFIGEDSGNHVNNYLWAYNVDTGALSRILSTPAGAESTGLHGVDSLNGWTYVLSSFQHPGEYTGGTSAAVKTAVEPLINARYKNKLGAAVGYLTAAPSAVKLG